MSKSIIATFTAAAVAVAAALLLTGCERAIDMTGKPVSFSAVAMDYAAGTRSDLPDTRVIYGDITETGTKSQAIEWIKGDLITIHSPQCTRIQSDGDKQTCEYIVTEVGSDDASQAGIGLPYYIAEGLQWGGNVAHTFYALYPGVGTGGVTATISGKDITGAIPQSQGFEDIEEIGGTGNMVVEPDMRNMYMTAKTQVSAGNVGNDITLEFLPLSTAIEFTITNKFDAHKKNMVVDSVALISSGHAISGGFKVDMDKAGRYAATAYERPETTLADGTTAANSDSVIIDFSASPVSVAYGKTLTFTFFLNPGNTTDVNDLTFEIKGTNSNDNSRFVRKARLENSSKEGLSFLTHQKTRISGLMVPEGVLWAIDAEPAATLTEWLTLPSEDGDVYFDVTFGTNSVE